jgi:hypothetical protein
MMLISLILSYATSNKKRKEGVPVIFTKLPLTVKISQGCFSTESRRFQFHNIFTPQIFEGFPFLHTRPETICPGTSKLLCWRVQLQPPAKWGAGVPGQQLQCIRHAPAQTVPFMLAGGL